MKFKKEIFLILFLAAPSAFAAENAIHFQGRLTDKQGRPISGPDNRVRFSIFPAATGPTSVWDGAEQVVASNESGLFSTEVGPIPIEIFSQIDLFLQVSVLSNGALKPLLPRQKLSSVPYAIRAEYAANTAPEFRIPPGMIAMFASACPEGWTRFDRLDNRVAIGTPTYTGYLGGSSDITGLEISSSGAHSHIVSSHTHTTPDHEHPLDVVLDYGGPQVIIGSITVAQGGVLKVAANSGTIPPRPFLIPRPKAQTTFGGGGITGEASPPTDVQGEHAHAITSNGTWLPPNLGIVYCEKD